MARTSHPPLPALRQILREAGENIRLARLRRGFSATLVSERSGLSRPTLRAIERGEPGVTIGAYASVLNTLGLAADLRSVARDDELGRKLQDLALRTRPRQRSSSQSPQRKPRR